MFRTRGTTNQLSLVPVFKLHKSPHMALTINYLCIFPPSHLSAKERRGISGKVVNSSHCKLSKKAPSVTVQPSPESARHHMTKGQSDLPSGLVFWDRRNFCFLSHVSKLQLPCLSGSVSWESWAGQKDGGALQR